MEVFSQSWAIGVLRGGGVGGQGAEISTWGGGRGRGWNKCFYTINLLIILLNLYIVVYLSSWHRCWIHYVFSSCFRWTSRVSGYIMFTAKVMPWKKNNKRWKKTEKNEKEEKSKSLQIWKVSSLTIKRFAKQILKTLLCVLVCPPSVRSDPSLWGHCPSIHLSIVDRDMVWKLVKLQSAYNELRFDVGTVLALHKSFVFRSLIGTLSKRYGDVKVD